MEVGGGGGGRGSEGRRDVSGGWGWKGVKGREERGKQTLEMEARGIRTGAHTLRDDAMSDGFEPR